MADFNSCLPVSEGILAPVDRSRRPHSPTWDCYARTARTVLWAFCGKPGRRWWRASGRRGRCCGLSARSPAGVGGGHQRVDAWVSPQTAVIAAGRVSSAATAIVSRSCLCPGMGPGVGILRSGGYLPRPAGYAAGHWQLGVASQRSGRAATSSARRSRGGATRSCTQR